MKPLQISLCLVCYISLYSFLEAVNENSESATTPSESLVKQLLSAASSLSSDVGEPAPPAPIVLDRPVPTDNNSSKYVLPPDSAREPDCKPPCLQEGVCRVVSLREDVTRSPRSVCFCREDFTGPACENNKQFPLTSCNDATCKNGGMCAGTTEKPSCLCKPKTRGMTCERRLHDFKVNAGVSQLGLDIQWNSSFADPQSVSYKTMESEVCKKLIEASRFGNNLDLVATFVGCSIVDYEKETSPLRANLLLELDYNDQLASTITEDVIHKHLLSGLQLKREIPIDIGDTQQGQTKVRLRITHMDPCITGNNDCSHYASCISELPGLYTCRCNSFSFDASNDPLYPGRRCIYDGLIIITFFIVGTLMSSLICIACGCRRTIWYRYRHKGERENSALISMPSTYEI